jgi:DNA-binding NarL/FixJ family response regulator
MGPIRVVVADDDLLVREGVASLLDGSRFEVVGRAGDVTELMQLVREHLPGLVVLDIRMPPSHTTEVSTPHPTTKLVTAGEPTASAYLRVSGHSSGFSLIELTSDIDQRLRRPAGGARPLPASG